MSKIMGVTVGTPMHPGRAAEAGAAVRYTAQTLTDAQKTQARENIGAASAENEMHYIVGNSTEAGVWLGTCDKITEYREGLTILYKTNVAGVSGGSTLNINNLGAVAVRRNASTAVTTIYPAGTVLMLTYSAESWLTADYDANTKNTAGTSNKAATKMYLVGGTSQSSSGVTTYSNKNVYIGTDDCLYSNGAKVATAAEFNGLTLSMHTDGLLYLFKDGVPVGNGVALPEGGIQGYVDSDNNIVLTGNHPDGTLVKYKMTDGTLIDIGELSFVPDGPTNWADPTSADWVLNARLSQSTAEAKENAGSIVTNFIPAKMGDVVRLKGFDLKTKINSQHMNTLIYNSSKTWQNASAVTTISTGSNDGAINSVTVDGDISTYTVLMQDDGEQKATSATAYIRFTGSLLPGYTAEDVIITVNEPIE